VPRLRRNVQRRDVTRHVTTIAATHTQRGAPGDVTSDTYKEIDDMEVPLLNG